MSDMHACGSKLFLDRQTQSLVHACAFGVIITLSSYRGSMHRCRNGGGGGGGGGGGSGGSSPPIIL